MTHLLAVHAATGAHAHAANLLGALLLLACVAAYVTALTLALVWIADHKEA